MLALLAQLVNLICDVTIFLIIAQIILSWLIIFEVIKVNNFQARHLVDTLNRWTENLYRPVRRYLPVMGGFDFSPIIVVIGIEIARSILLGILR